ncbi:MAG: oxidoreductase, partial [Candidatus Margulisbacteria bacterium]|nr:oxidoreductase [Candidatus Margulisiibacteriota bacterium]
ELKEIVEVYKSSKQQLMVGFNRRFAPQTKQAKELLGNTSDLVINCRVNAGFVPADSWVHDAAEGGGRVVGEVCHFVDLIQELSGSLPTKVFAESTNDKGQDNLVITLKMLNGSVATILYASQGDKLLPRERIEVFSKNSVCVIDNFKSLFFAKDGKSTKKKSFNLDRGYQGEFAAFFSSIKDGKIAVNFEDYLYTTLTTFAIIDSIRTGAPKEINEYLNSL